MTKPKPSTFDRMRIWVNEQHKLPGVFVPIRVTNPLNNRRGWRPVWQNSKRARNAVHLELIARRLPKSLPATVTMTRYGPRALDQQCGLNASMKSVRDGVADYFGVDDADKRYTWIYRQEQATFFGVRVEIDPAETAGPATLIEKDGLI